MKKVLLILILTNFTTAYAGGASGLLRFAGNGTTKVFKSAADDAAGIKSGLRSLSKAKIMETSDDPILADVPFFAEVSLRILDINPNLKMDEVIEIIKRSIISEVDVIRASAKAKAGEKVSLADVVDMEKAIELAKETL